MANQKVDTKAAAKFLGIKPNTLEIWRIKKLGPKYSKLGRRVLYDIDDLEEYYASKKIFTVDTYHLK
jgi:hypothetical protein